jgi:hypothetical protein
MSEATKDEAYLGDGLYAAFDGWHITLRAAREGGDHWVGLEPAVFRELMRFAERINTKYKVEHFKWPTWNNPYALYVALTI